MYVCVLHVGTWCPGKRVTGGCEPSSGFWDLSQGPLEEQPVLLTTDPSLHNPFYLIIKKHG